MTFFRNTLYALAACSTLFSSTIWANSFLTTYINLSDTGICADSDGYPLYIWSHLSGSLGQLQTPSSGKIYVYTTNSEKDCFTHPTSGQNIGYIVDTGIYDGKGNYLFRSYGANGKLNNSMYLPYHSALIYVDYGIKVTKDLTLTVTHA